MKRLALSVSLVLALAIAVPVALAATKTVAVKDNFFSPSTASVKKGTTVKWAWKGSNPHNVTGSGGLKSSTMSSGSYSKKFTKKGTFSYRCTIHSGMNGKIKVS